MLSGYLSPSAEELNNFGITLAQQGRLGEATLHFQRAVESKPDFPQAHYNLAITLQDQGRLPEAIASYRQALHFHPGYVQAHHGLGTALKEQNHPAEAAACYQRALQLDPNFVDAHHDLGHVFKEQGRLAEAAACYQRALDLRPNYVEAHTNLGNVFYEQGQAAAAITCYRRALELRPDFAIAHVNLGNAWKDQEQIAEAIASYERALKVDPSCAEIHINLGLAFDKVGKLEAAVTCYQRALSLKPENAEAYHSLAIALEKQEKPAEAKACYQNLLRSHPGHADRQLWRLRLAGLCPAVFASAQAIDDYRGALLQEVENSPPLHLDEHMAKLADSGAQPPFNLLYHGRDNRPLKEAYAKMFRYAGPEPMRGDAARPQIGMVVTPGHEGIFLRFWQGMLARMKNNRFQLVIICSQAGAARIRADLKNDTVRLLPIPYRLDLALATIRAARLDVLYYWEVGSDATNYFLPFFRLAPLQCTSLAIQETSGIAQIDYYLSSALIEPENPETHYTEKLILAKTLLTCHPRPNMPQSFKAREAFGFRSGQHLYLCAQNLRKIHPDFDSLLGEILRRDAEGTLVLVQDRPGYLAEKLRRRFADTVPDVLDRIVLLPEQTYPDYLSLVSAADLILDPLHYNGGTTSYEGMALGKPVVTCPGPFQISRAVLAFYRKMGIRGCVAGSSEEYIKMAVALGTDADYREAAGKEIVAAGDNLFEDIEAIREHEQLFERLVEEARS